MSVSVGRPTLSVTYFCLLIDHPMSFWEPKLIIEDPAYLFENRADVEEFVNTISSN